MPKPVITCPECGGRFPQGHHRQLFCIPAHGRTYNKRVESESMAVMGLAKAWRAARSAPAGPLREAGKEAFILLCRQIDASNTADLKAGRMNPTRLFAIRRNMGLLG